jgi:hypothetical protein
MPTNTRGGFAPLRIPGVGLLPASVQGAANTYNVAVTRLQEAASRRDALTHPNAVEAARQLDVSAFKKTAKVGHTHANRHAQDILDAAQEVEGLQQMAVDREAELIGAARNAKVPAPSDLSAEREAVAELAQLFAASRLQASVARWLSDPERPFVSAASSPLEVALRAVSGALDPTPHVPSMFDVSQAVSPRGAAVELPGGERFAISGPAVNANDAVEGIH